MSIILICKDCTYYNLTIEAIEKHQDETAHSWMVIHTPTNIHELGGLK
jgi:hypothetical protein